MILNNPNIYIFLILENNRKMVRYDKDNLYIDSYDIDTDSKVRNKVFKSVDQSASVCGFAGHVYVEVGKRTVKSSSGPSQFSSNGRDTTPDSYTYKSYECARCHDRIERHF